MAKKQERPPEPPPAPGPVPNNQEQDQSRGATGTATTRDETKDGAIAETAAHQAPGVPHVSAHDVKLLTWREAAREATMMRIGNVPIVDLIAQVTSIPTLKAIVKLMAAPDLESQATLALTTVLAK